MLLKDDRTYVVPDSDSQTLSPTGQNPNSHSQNPMIRSRTDNLPRNRVSIGRLRNLSRTLGTRQRLEFGSFRAAAPPSTRERTEDQATFTKHLIPTTAPA